VPWLSIVLEVDAQRAEALGDALLARGVLSVDITDAWAGTPQEFALFQEPGEPGAEVSSWSRARVAVLAPQDADPGRLLEAAAGEAGMSAVPPFQTQAVEDCDWVRITQSQFPPVRISERLWIVPSWHSAPDPGAVNLAIDPGLAFGTGTHATTRLCLEWLDRHIIGGERVLDYGCGSGILAIAALKLGAAAACGVDIDDNALLAARGNAEQNRVTVRYQSAAEHRPAADADIVLANILANPLILLAPLLASAARPGGYLVLSGVLDHQAAAVRAAYERWFAFAPDVSREGWTLLSAQRLAGETP